LTLLNGQDEERKAALSKVEDTDRRFEALQHAHAALQQQLAVADEAARDAAESRNVQQQLLHAQQEHRQEMEQLQQTLQQTQENFRGSQAQASQLQAELQAAHQRADDNSTTASAAESELLEKISEINEKCARFYQDREDARESLADAQSAAAAYKKALLAAKEACKSPVVLYLFASFVARESHKSPTPAHAVRVLIFCASPELPNN
jgi:chromosome segregation ATPase